MKHAGEKLGMFFLMVMLASPIWADAAGTGESLECLQLALRCEPNALTPSEELTMRVMLENRCQKPQLIVGDLRWGHSAGLTLNIHSEAGEEVFPRFLDSDRFTAQEISDPARLVWLHGGHFLGVSRIDLAGDLFKDLGAYSMRVVYVSPATPSVAADERVLLRSAGAIESNECVVQTVAGGSSPASPASSVSERGHLGDQEGDRE